MADFELLSDVLHNKDRASRRAAIAEAESCALVFFDGVLGVLSPEEPVIGSVCFSNGALEKHFGDITANHDGETPHSGENRREILEKIWPRENGIVERFSAFPLGGAVENWSDLGGGLFGSVYRKMRDVTAPIFMVLLGHLPSVALV